MEHRRCETADGATSFLGALILAFNIDDNVRRRRALIPRDASKPAPQDAGLCVRQSLGTYASGRPYFTKPA
jgi:hypothetical protein